MLVLGLEGSPRKKGNTRFLLSAFMEASEKLGAKTITIHAAEENILPCKELVVCEKKGYCPIDDAMPERIYSLLWEADLIVTASPVFFYHVTAQLKALIDRCQTMWARKYRFRLADPGRKHRIGYVFAVAASQGKNLFDGINTTAKIFYDAVGARFAGSLVYRGIEKRGDMKKHATVIQDVQELAEKLVAPLVKRERVLFLGRDNTCYSQMAQAFARHLGGDRVDARSAGIFPGEKPYPLMEKVMTEKGLDMAFRKPTAPENVAFGLPPQRVVSLASDCAIPGVPTDFWQIDRVDDPGLGILRNIRDDIENKVRVLLSK